ncbi:MAG: N-6 DNA methylase [Clostridia bacterium]|nr:N-6 DNA methylase [Clostridia bacterium]
MSNNNSFEIDALNSERDVEAKLIQPLFKDILGYPNKNLYWDVAVEFNNGRERFVKKADLAAYHGNKPVIVVEAKRPTETLQSGIDQVDSYAFALQTPFSVITNGKAFILRGYYSSNKRINIIESTVEELQRDNWDKLKRLISYSDILTSISDNPNIVMLPDQEKIRDFRRFFRSIHSIIRDREKLDPATCFDELSKLLFLKAAEEERMSKGDSNSVLTIEVLNELEKLGVGIKYINDKINESIKQVFPDVFEGEIKINLSVDTLKEVLKNMQNFKMKQDDADIKGRAFEEFLPTQLRGKGLGQYFTPRPVVNFMVNMAEISIYDVVADFSCGSGGFLIKAFEHIQKLIDELPDGTLQRLGTKKGQLLDDVRKYQIHGIDAEPRAARTAKMNMLMWGDGNNISRGNALDIKDKTGKEYSIKEYDKDIPNSGCTIILANPPFGSKEKEPDILKRYFLGSKISKRATQKTEILFLEKGLKLLRPGGKMLIVLPLGLLSNDSYQYIRDYIHSEAEIRAIVSLPTHTFVQSGVDTIKTCVLYLQKFTEEKKELYENKTNGLPQEKIREILMTDKDFDYPVFMATAEFVGFEPSGRSIVTDGEKTDLDLILEDFQNQSTISIPELDLMEFAESYYSEKTFYRIDQTVRGTQRNLKNSFVVNLSDTHSRLDPAFYVFKYKVEPMMQSFEPLGNKIEEGRERFRPQNDDEMDREYPILSVTNNEGVIFNEYRKGEEFTQSYKKVKEGDIVYNPYRVNVGSIGVVPEELDGGFVSPAYVVFRSKAYKPEFIVELLKSPFYKLYIDVLSTGSIRDSLSYDLLETIKVPEVHDEKQESIYKLINETKQRILDLQGGILGKKDEIVKELHSLIK